VVLVALFHSRYDAFGNLTQDSQSGVSTTYYTYNALDELTLISPPSGLSATFTRDALGRLKTRTLSTTPTNTLDTYGYVGTSETVFEIATSGDSTSTTRGAIGVDGSRLAVRTAAVSFTLPDLHGSIAGLFALTPTSLSDAYRYDGYGVTVATSGSTTNQLLAAGSSQPATAIEPIQQRLELEHLIDRGPDGGEQHATVGPLDVGDQLCLGSAVP
jgi:YD repeat-containing protein